MRSTFRYRQIHLDFHTSEHVPDVGAAFDKKQFVDALKTGNVDSVTVFAVCHHGWAYYPTKVGKVHPNLKRPDLLGDMVNACRENDINVPAYITVQWNERVAREHPEWRVVKGDAASQQSDLNQMNAGWHSICLSNQGYVDLVIAQAHEVMDHCKPDGLFFDILLMWDCCCQNCIDRMKRDGLDPNKKEDRLRNHRNVIIDYYKRVSEAVHKKDPDMRVFHNSGHIYKGERERWNHFTHLELESLPTAGWGYDHFPLSARYANTLGMEYLGMTGKFHTSWGEFGGFKRPVALEYECALMTSLGARSSVGDQLHPSGKMDMDTYRVIGPGYARVKQLEPFALGATPRSEIALLSAEAVHHSREFESVDMGAARMLNELHLMYDVIDTNEDFGKYKLLVLPDVIKLDAKLADRIKSYVKKGGKLILSGSSGMNADATAFAIDIKASVNGMCDFNPDYVKATAGLDKDLTESPFVMYAAAHKVKAKGATVLAETWNPYFNRTWEHFCSHQHTPYRMEKSNDNDAVIQDGNIVYIAYPIFKTYYDRGQPLYKYIVRGAIEKLLPVRDVHVSLPSSGRMSVMEQKDKNRTILHLLYAEIQPRGESGAGWGRGVKMLIIEDVNPIYDIPCRIRMPKKPSRVYGAVSGKDIPFTYENGYAQFTVEKVYVHEAAVIEN
ncbi:MAG: beta-galactosidase trimerization domain-containing protein [Spirochaetes bacterium]|nr:beta-galactosidase trimerization domain-containing protein [Spirochaetota bacterium]